MGTPESSEVPALQFGREVWKWVVPVLRWTMVGQEADELQQGDVEKEKRQVPGTQIGRY